MGLKNNPELLKRQKWSRHRSASAFFHVIMYKTGYYSLNNHRNAGEDDT